MFDWVQKHKRIAQIFLFLIAITFATWGIESYTRFRSSRDTVATVNGSDISSRELGEEVRRQQEQLRRVFGQQVDPAIFDSPEARRSILDSLVSQRLVASAALKSNLTVTDDLLYETIASNPAFHIDGKFSRTAYETLLRSQNPPMTPQQFEARMRYELSLQQLTHAVGDSAIPSRALSGRLAALETQQREVAEVRITAQQFASQVKIDDAKLKAYYDANSGEFATPERVRAEYVVLSAEGLAKQDPVTEADIKAAYDARASQYQVEEQRRASHILVPTQEEADKLLAEVKKSPGRFAELAKKHSKDSGSAAKGGDLGWFGRGMMVKPFEDLVFKLQQNEMQIVQSEFGFHVVRLTGVQAPRARPFEEVRKELTDEVAKQKGARKFAEAAEQFGNLVYEQPDSLKPAAERYKLQVQTTGWIVKSAAQELGALDNPKLLAALFSADSLKNKRNTDAIEVGPNTLVAARVVEHRSAAQRGFDEVKGEIAELLRRRESAELAHKDGAAKLEVLRKGEDPGVKWSPSKTVSRRDAQGLQGEVLRQAVSADVSRLPAYAGMPVGGGYVLLRITKVIEGNSGPQPDSDGRVSGMLGASQFQAYVASLRNRADIEINRANLEKK